MLSTPEVLVKFDETVRDESGVTYTTRVIGAETPLGQWEGWLEFTAEGSGKVITTERETTQPNRVDLGYWATGLSRVFIEGSLKRALDNISPTASVPRAEAPPRSAAPHKPRQSPQPDSRIPVLDPFSVYLQGETILRQQLAALSVDHMRAVIDAYQLDVGRIETGANAADLADQIVSAVRAQRTSG